MRNQIVLNHAYNILICPLDYVPLQKYSFEITWYKQGNVLELNYIGTFKITYFGYCIDKSWMYLYQ